MLTVIGRPQWNSRLIPRAPCSKLRARQMRRPGMNAKTADIIAYYDTQAQRKLRDFIYSNRRVECAWEAITQYGGTPARILEVGCGVGSVCYRLSRRFPLAEIVGVDFSPGNLAIAERAFRRDNLRFTLMSVDTPFDLGLFDLTILMDVYEHVSPGHRRQLHSNLQCSLRGDKRVIATFPTPRHIAWLRANCPTEVQPVDEDITPDVVCSLARDIGVSLLMYREVDVWRQGDYAHAVLGASGFPAPVAVRNHSRAVRGLLRLKNWVEYRRRLAKIKASGLMTL